LPPHYHGAATIWPEILKVLIAGIYFQLAADDYKFLKAWEDTAKPINLIMRQLAVPTPYLIGDIKVYSCEIKGKLILFDTGPVTDKALRYLEKNVDAMSPLQDFVVPVEAQ
jgi:hypothetical protein